VQVVLVAVGVAAFSRLATLVLLARVALPYSLAPPEAQP
jgi:hypothetical protein